MNSKKETPAEATMPPFTKPKVKEDLESDEEPSNPAFDAHQRGRQLKKEDLSKGFY
jgi:hypothetical protein